MQDLIKSLSQLLTPFKPRIHRLTKLAQQLDAWDKSGEHKAGEEGIYAKVIQLAGSKEHMVEVMHMFAEAFSKAEMTEYWFPVMDNQEYGMCTFMIWMQMKKEILIRKRLIEAPKNNDSRLGFKNSSNYTDLLDETVQKLFKCTEFIKSNRPPERFTGNMQAIELEGISWSNPINDLKRSYWLSVDRHGIAINGDKLEGYDLNNKNSRELIAAEAIAALYGAYDRKAALEKYNSDSVQTAQTEFRDLYQSVFNKDLFDSLDPDDAEYSISWFGGDEAFGAIITAACLLAQEDSDTDISKRLESLSSEGDYFKFTDLFMILKRDVLSMTDRIVSTGEWGHDFPLMIFADEHEDPGSYPDLDGEEWVSRLNNYVLRLWEFTPFADDYAEPVQLMFSPWEEDRQTKVLSYRHPSGNHEMSKRISESCYYYIDRDGTAYVREYNEALDLGCRQTRATVACTIIRDVMGDYNMGETLNRYIDDIRKSADERVKELEAAEMAEAAIGIVQSNSYFFD